MNCGTCKHEAVCVFKAMAAQLKKDHPSVPGETFSIEVKCKHYLHDGLSIKDMQKTMPPYPYPPQYDQPMRPPYEITCQPGGETTRYISPEELRQLTQQAGGGK